MIPHNVQYEDGLILLLMGIVLNNMNGDFYGTIITRKE